MESVVDVRGSISNSSFVFKNFITDVVLAWLGLTISMTVLRPFGLIEVMDFFMEYTGSVDGKRKPLPMEIQRIGVGNALPTLRWDVLGAGRRGVGHRSPAAWLYHHENWGMDGIEMDD